MGNSTSRLNEIFDSLDEDKSGHVSMTEVQQWVADEQFMDNPEFKGETVKDIAKTLLATMDKDGDGQVSREELIKYFKALSSKEVDALTLSLTKDKKAKALRRIFSLIDTDRSGEVSKEEVIAWMANEKSWANTNEYFPESSREDIWRAIDANADAAIDYPEFARYFSSWTIRQLREATNMLVARHETERLKQAADKEANAVAASHLAASMRVQLKAAEREAKANEESSSETATEPRAGPAAHLPALPAGFRVV